MKTLKTLVLLLVGALTLVGCETADNGGNDKKKSLILVADKTIIYDNGIDGATFTAYYDGMVLTEGYDLYIGAGDEVVVGNKFTSTTQGTFEIWASYGTVISNTVNVNVIPTPPPAPAAPEDTNPSKTNFKRRILLTQFTGTGCGYCPLMMNALHEVLTNNIYGDKVVIAAAHLFSDSDPCWLGEAKTLDNALNVGSYPAVYSDLDRNGYGDSNFPSLKSCIDNAERRTTVKGGIAVNSEYHAEEEYIVINATVKAKETTEFRVGAWLLEDNIYGKQEVYPNPYNPNELIQPLEGVNFDYHNNVIRLAESKAADTDFSGFSLGVIEAGKTASREFAFRLKPHYTNANARYYNHNNLRVIVFISTKEGNKWLVNNVVKCPKHGSVDFEYEN